MTSTNLPQIRKNYPQANGEVLVKFHESYIRSIDETIDRRFRFNWVMFVILGSLLLGVGYLNKEFADQYAGKLVSLMGLGLGIAQCLVWLLTLLSFQSLLSAKFAVLERVESDLDCAMHADENSIYTKRSYIPLLKIEMAMPIIASAALGIVFVLIYQTTI